MCLPTEVLETIKTLGDAPKPFPQSAQYKKNVKGENCSVPDPDEAELEAEKPGNPKSKAKKNIVVLMSKALRPRKRMLKMQLLHVKILLHPGFTPV